MRTGRSVALLLLACAAAAAANILLRTQEDGRRAFRNSSLIDPSLNVESIRIERRGSPPTVLEKTPTWRLTQPYAGSVDEPVVLKLLDAIAFTPVTDAMSESELLKLGRSRSDFALNDPVVKISVSGGFGTQTISIGGPAPAADGVYAAVDGRESVLLVSSKVLSAVDLPPESFRRRSLFLTGPESVSSFDIKRGSSSMLVFSRDGDGWTMNGKQASPKKVVDFLSELTAAKARSFVWPVGASNETDRASVVLLSGYGLDPEGAVTVTLKSIDGVARQVSFGKPAGEGDVYALIQNASAVVTVSASLRDTASQEAVMFTDSRLFPVEAKDVPFFSISDGDAVYAFSRSGDGVWRFDSPISALADAASIDEVLARILSLSPADSDPGGIGISLTTNSATIRVSRSSVLVGGFERLRSRQMLRIEAKDVKRIVQTLGGPADKPMSVVYGRDRQVWNVESSDGSMSAVKNEGVDRVLSAINPLEAEKVEKLKVTAADLDRYGLGTPYLTVAIDQERENSVRRNILVGAKTKGGRFATIGSADAVFIVSDAVVDALSAPLVGK